MTQWDFTGWRAGKFGCISTKLFSVLCYAMPSHLLITSALELCVSCKLIVTLNNTLDQIIALRTLLSWWLVFVQGKAQIYCNRTWCKLAKAYISIFLSIVSRVHTSAQSSELVCAWFCTEDKEAVPCRETLCTGCTEILCFSLLLQQVVQGRDCCGVWVCVCVCRYRICTAGPFSRRDCCRRATT